MELGRRLLDVPPDHAGSPAVQRVGKGDLWLDEAESETFQGQLGQDRRSGGQRVDRRADVMEETWKRQLRRSNTATDGFGGFEHHHRPPGPPRG